MFTQRATACRRASARPRPQLFRPSQKCTAFVLSFTWHLANHRFTLVFSLGPAACRPLTCALPSLTLPTPPTPDSSNSPSTFHTGTPIPCVSASAPAPPSRSPPPPNRPPPPAPLPPRDLSCLQIACLLLAHGSDHVFLDAFPPAELPCPPGTSPGPLPAGRPPAAGPRVGPPRQGRQGHRPPPAVLRARPDRAGGRVRQERRHGLRARARQLAQGDQG